MVLTTLMVTILGTSLNGCDSKVVQFIFGDSLSDAGNNNRLSRSLAKANLPWYGIDFGNGLPNGRFSNGRTVADIIGKGRETLCPFNFVKLNLIRLLGWTWFHSRALDVNL